MSPKVENIFTIIRSAALPAALALLGVFGMRYLNQQDKVLESVVSIQMDMVVVKSELSHINKEGDRFREELGKLNNRVDDVIERSEKEKQDK